MPFLSNPSDVQPRNTNINNLFQLSKHILNFVFPFFTFHSESYTDSRVTDDNSSKELTNAVTKFWITNN